MLRDVLLVGVANRSMGMTLLLLALFAIGIAIVATQVASPFLYALF